MSRMKEFAIAREEKAERRAQLMAFVESHGYACTVLDADHIAIEIGYAADGRLLGTHRFVSGLSVAAVREIIGY